MTRSLWLVLLCLWALARPARAGGDEVAEVERVWGFSRGRAALAPERVVGTADRGLLFAGACEDCHVREAAAWRESGHRQSWTRALFQAAYRVEPMAECRNCHQPLTAVPTGFALKSGEARALRGEGVGCAVCHVREGVVLATRASGRAPHEVRSAPLLGSAAFCGGCHQFNFPEHRSDGRLAFTSEPMQDTLEEWRRHGGDKTCQGCHMARGGHRFLGGYDRQTLGEAVAVTPRLRETGEGAALELGLRVLAGHAVPTGDLFRSLVVTATLVDGRGRAVGSAEPLVLTRRFVDVAERGEDGREHLVRRQALDGRLQPGEVRDVALALPRAKGAVRVRYRVALHRLPPGVPPSKDIISVLAEGALPLSAGTLAGTRISLQSEEKTR